MFKRATTVIAAAALVCLAPAAGHALTPYSQDFEGLLQPDLNALANDGWVVFGNVYNADGVYQYGYGTFPAPNDGAAFCAIATGEGGDSQGAQQLSVYSDYNNLDHGQGFLIEANVFQEQMVSAAEVGQTWTFTFDFKRGNLAGASTAAAFIKTLNPAAGYALTNIVTADMTRVGTEWKRLSISLPIDASLVGQIFQFGFMNTASNYEPSGIFYDNLQFGQGAMSGVPSGTTAAGATLAQNYPNPFNPSTRIDFALDAAGPVQVTVFDLAGRRVATLHDGVLGAGEHHVVWDGTTSSGAPAAAGQYRYVLRTDAGQVSRSMILLK